MKIILQSLKLIYFKGAKNLEINFNPEITEISGANETCKTTLFDGFAWLLFGKDSQDRSDFEIKTLNSDNSVIEKIDHEVSGRLLIDDQKLELKKVYREVWQTKRGEPIERMTGHETLCFYDGMAIPITDYNNRIRSILNEETFKLITNPYQFNTDSNKWGWRERREVLIKMSGEITDQAIVNQYPEFTDFIAELNGKSISDMKLKIATEKAAAVKAQKEIPTRIDEVKKGTPEPLDYTLIGNKKTNVENDINNVDLQISSKQKASEQEFEKIQTKQSEINSLRTKQNQIVFSAKEAEQNRVFKANENYREQNNKITSLSNEWRQVDNEIKSLNSEILRDRSQVELCDRNMEKLREQYRQINESVFNPNSTVLVCPLFKHNCSDQFALSEFENSNETALENFNVDKRNKLNGINGNGLSEKNTQEVYEKAIKESEGAIEIKKGRLTTLQSQIEILRKDVAETSIQEPETIIPENIKEWIELEYQIKTIEKELSEFKPVDNSELTEKRKGLVIELDELKKQLATKDQIEVSENRIKELNKEARILAQQIADLEKIEYNILQFSKVKINEIDKVINSKFKYVRFKLFDTQINGSEIECCECTYKGIPFQSLNHAGQVISGIDIINAISEYYGISAPVWIDNRESINELIEIKSQLINLWVSTDKILTVS